MTSATGESFSPRSVSKHVPDSACVTLTATPYFSSKAGITALMRFSSLVVYITSLPPSLPAEGLVGSFGTDSSPPWQAARPRPTAHPPTPKNARRVNRLIDRLVLSLSYKMPSSTSRRALCTAWSALEPTTGQHLRSV